MSNSEYMKWMNTVQSVVRVRLSPSHEEYANARAEYEALTGTADTYEHNDIWNNIIDKYGKLWVLENISLLDAQKFAEPIRIANPNECVSLYTDDKSFIGNTSWADQMKHFFISWGSTYPLTGSKGT